MASCSPPSKEHQKLVDTCVNQHYEQGIYDAKTGEKVTPKNNISHLTLVLGACSSKVNLYLNGYRVSPIIEFNDLFLEIHDNIKPYYIKKLKCESDVAQCK